MTTWRQITVKNVRETVSRWKISARRLLRTRKDHRQGQLRRGQTGHTHCHQNQGKYSHINTSNVRLNRSFVSSSSSSFFCFGRRARPSGAAEPPARPAQAAPPPPHQLDQCDTVFTGRASDIFEMLIRSVNIWRLCRSCCLIEFQGRIDFSLARLRAAIVFVGFVDPGAPLKIFRFDSAQGALTRLTTNFVKRWRHKGHRTTYFGVRFRRKNWGYLILETVQKLFFHKLGWSAARPTRRGYRRRSITICHRSGRDRCKPAADRRGRRSRQERAERQESQGRRTASPRIWHSNDFANRILTFDTSKVKINKRLCHSCRFVGVNFTQKTDTFRPNINKFMFSLCQFRFIILFRDFFYFILGECQNILKFFPYNVPQCKNEVTITLTLKHTYYLYISNFECLKIVFLLQLVLWL